MVPLPDGSAVVVGAGAVWTIWRDTLHLLPVVADESKLIHPILHRRLIDAARVLPGRPEALAGHEHFERAMESVDLTPVVWIRMFRCGGGGGSPTANGRVF